MTLFFKQYRNIPRTHVDTASAVMMCHFTTVKKTAMTMGPDLKPQKKVTWFDKDGLEQPTEQKVELSTSWYLNTPNIILMQATDDAGAPRADGPGVDYQSQPGEKAGAVKTDKRGALPEEMSYFQNHATHEVGHAIGAHTLKRGKYAIKGDDFIKEWADWKDGGSAEDFVRMLGFSSGFDKQTFRVAVPHRPGANPQKDFSGTDVRAFFEGLLDHGLTAMDTHVVAKEFGNSAKAALDALKNEASLKSLPLLPTLDLVQKVLPSAAWVFPQGINGAKRVTMKNNNTWQNYDARVWSSRVSTYATSAPGELFAEIYTARFVNQTVPPALNGHSVDDFLTEVTKADPKELGLPGAADKKPDAGAGPGTAA